MKTDTSFLPFAIELARAGIRVHPLRKRDKIPTEQSWPTAATTDEETIRRWWGREPQANIGIVPGRQSGIVVLDIDPRSDGENGLRLFQERFGTLPETRAVRTGSGGWHYYFKHPEGDDLKKRAQIDGCPGVELYAGDNSNIVAPPSIHPCGGRYEWVGMAENVAELPPAFLEFLRSEKQTVYTKPESQTTYTGPKGPAASPESLQQYLSEKGIRVKKRKDIPGGVGFLIDCPMNMGHPSSDSDTMATWRHDGLGFKCMHARCEPFGWREFREKIDPGHGARAEDIELHSIDHATGEIVPAAGGDAQIGPRETSPARPDPNRPRPLITNVSLTKGTKKDKDGETVDCTIWNAKTVIEIGEEIQKANAGQPVLISGQLMAYKSYEPGKIATKKDLVFFGKHRELFGWMRGNGNKVYWPTSAPKEANGARENGSVVTLVNREELFEYLRINTKPDYESVECLPHEPAVTNLLYLPIALPQPTGAAIREFMGMLNPETDIDRGLLLAALLTPAWGGPPGKRPAFIFTSRFGKGTGKSTTADWFCDVYGGRISIRPEEENWAQVQGRLLSNDALATRCILIDNAKKKLQGQELEYMLTTPVFDGHKMYVGQMSRPNRMTTYITANSPSLGSDLATRAVKIQFGKQKNESTFDRWIVGFMAERRLELLADIYDILRGGDRCKIAPENGDRWAMWQDGVLAKLPIGNELAAAIKARRPEMDTDAEEAEDIRAAIENHLEACGHDLQSQVVRIPASRMYDLIRDAGLADKSFSNAGMGGWLRNMMDEIGPLKRLVKDKSHKKGRAWFYTLPNRQRQLNGIDIPPTELYAKPPESPS